MKTTIRIKLRFSHGVTTSGRIVYVVTKEGESRRISTGLPLSKSEWDNKTERAVMTEISSRDEIDKVNEQIDREVALLRTIVKKLEAEDEHYDFGRLHHLFMAHKCEMSLAAFMRQEIKYKMMSGHHGTARNYLTSLKSFLAFCNGVEVPVKTIASDMMEDYQAWLEERGVCRNTTSFYMRNLRAIYMRMVKAELTIDRHPFDNVYTGVDKTKKRAITENDIIKLKNLNLEDNRKLCFVRDLFLLSFYMMGISFVDLAFLKKTDLKGLHLTYTRCKTGQQITIGVIDKIQRLLDKYPAPDDSIYLLPIVTSRYKDERRQYKNALQLMNKYLKIIAGMAGLTTNLSSYTSRHTWASIAKMKNINIGTISEALGHKNESTTRIYLTTLDNGQVDRANALILKNL